MTLRLITAPTVPAVSLIEAKAHLRVVGTDEDMLITAMVDTATQAAEHETGRAMMPQTWEAGFDGFPAGFKFTQGMSQNIVGITYPESFKLTRGPAQSVVGITYIDTYGAIQTIASSLYKLVQDDFGCALIIPSFGSSWPACRNETDGIKVRYVAGYADAANVPSAIKSWILLHLGALFENRESEVIERGMQIKLGFADRLLDRYRVYI